VLIIRELCVRYNLGIPSLLLLGLVYGIYNEGFLSHTLMSTTAVPITAFNGLPLFLDTNVAFMVTIITAHALQAVLYPIIALRVMLPNVHDVPWLPKRALWFLCCFIVGVGSLTFFANNPTHGAGTLPGYFFLMSLSALLVLGAFKLRQHNLEVPENPNVLPKILTGGMFTLMLILPALAAGVVKSVTLAVLVWFLVTAWQYRFVSRTYGFSEQALLRLGIGHLATGMLLSIPLIVVMKHPQILELSLGYALVGISLVWFYRTYLTKPAVQTPENP
jgi:hypothetical protein